jgi:hypothetical protein
VSAASPRHIPVIVNPAAGPDRPVLKLLNHGFRAVGADWDVHLTRRAGDAARLARELRAAGAEMVAVCGGDGTVKEVAGALAGSGFPFAILPGGTGNALAQELTIPLDLAAAASLAGGAGTTGAGLRAGVPSLITPFAGDQASWAERVVQLGVGPRVPGLNSLTAQKLAAALQTAVSDTAMRSRAAALGEKIRAEDGIARAVDIIERQWPGAQRVDDFRFGSGANRSSG